ncbi:C4-dicarboxylate ABC transporter, partial [Streptomyces sp. SID8380]|nr:C4-dicarboxylate ABC transporter [Streptomyces sp. SID8380]
MAGHGRALLRFLAYPVLLVAPVLVAGLALARDWDPERVSP